VDKRIEGFLILGIIGRATCGVFEADVINCLSQPGNENIMAESRLRFDDRSLLIARGMHVC